jgi:hypothetical protein
LHHALPLTIPSKCKQKTIITSELVMQSLNNDISVVNALATESGQQCLFNTASISKPFPSY